MDMLMLNFLNDTQIPDSDWHKTAFRVKTESRALSDLCKRNYFNSQKLYMYMTPISQFTESNRQPRIPKVIPLSFKGANSKEPLSVCFNPIR
jgi:hypothetical protein